MNALSWHELAGGAAVRAIPDHLRRARRALVRNPAFVAIGLRELHVNESVGRGDALYPGEQLAYLAFGDDRTISEPWRNRLCWEPALTVASRGDAVATFLCTRRGVHPIHGLAHKPARG